MYNPENKVLFMKQTGFDSVPIKNYFENLDPFEREWDKDLGELEVDEIVFAFEHMPYLQYKTIVDAVTVTRNYLTWYSEYISPVPAHRLKLTWKMIDLTGNYERYLAKHETEISEVFVGHGPEKGNYIQPVLYMVWHGIPIEVIARLKREEVTVEGDTITVIDGEAGGKIYQFTSAPAAKAISIYSSIDTYYVDSKKNPYTRIRNNEEYFLYVMVREHLVNDQPVTVRAVFAKIKTASETVAGRLGVDGERYVYKNVERAGQLYRAVELEKTLGRPLNIQECEEIFDLKISRKFTVDLVHKMIETYKNIL